VLFGLIRLFFILKTCRIFCANLRAGKWIFIGRLYTLYGLYKGFMMKKLLSVFLCIICFGRFDYVLAINSDHVKVGVSGAVFVACALGAWYCFDKTGKLDPDKYELDFCDDSSKKAFEMERLRKFYKYLGWTLVGLSAGSGVYCGCKIYNLCSEIDLIKQGFEQLKRQDASQDYGYSFGCYKQRVLPIIYRHFQDLNAFKNADQSAIVSCYEECIDKIEQENFDYVSRPEWPGDEKARFNEERRGAMGKMLNDHLSYVVSNAWRGKDYNRLVGAVGNLLVNNPAKDDQNFRSEKHDWIDDFYNRVYDLEYDRFEKQQKEVHAQKLQEQRQKESKQTMVRKEKPDEEMEKDQEKEKRQKQEKNMQEQMELRRFQQEKEQQIKQEVENNKDFDKLTLNFAEIDPNQANARDLQKNILDKLDKIEDHKSREIRNVAKKLRTVRKNGLTDKNAVIEEITGLLGVGEGAQNRARLLVEKFFS